MKKTRQLKMYLREVYRRKRREDSFSVGRKINDLTQALHLQSKLPAESRDKDVIKTCVEQLKAIRSTPRFKEEFPCFPKFYKYITDPKNGFVLDDIKDL